MILAKRLGMVLTLGASLCLVTLAVGAWTEVYPSPETADWFFRNTTGTAVNVLHLEFEQEVTLNYSAVVGGDVMSGGMVLSGTMTGRTFDFVGGLVELGAIQINVPLGTVPALAQWLRFDASGSPVPVGEPFFTSIAVLGRLFGQGIVAAREANPEALMAAFDEFFESNAEFLVEASQALGMSLADSLMPIIMASPAEGIENFFNTVIGMLGVTELSDVTEGDVDFSALFALLGF